MMAQEEVQKAAPKPKRHWRSNKAQDNAPDAPAAPEASRVTEFAGNASGSSLSPPTSPSSPLQLDADFYWIADTGATSHMTPHRHWFNSYTPCRIPIRLADNTVIYAAGQGSVVFQPTLRGRKAESLEFTRVLHVPDLRSNLLSCLYLTRHKGLVIHISATTMTFQLHRKTLFTASIDSTNSAVLNGTTLASETAFSLSTLPTDISLWHRRFIHHNYADVKRMIQKKLVTGLKLESNAKPDPVCEPCIAGKMHSNPFPPSPNHNRAPLELIHSDLHGPLPVTTHSGYKYWITFIDDCSCFRAVYLLKAKSEAFEAFKDYKSWAENQLGAKIRALQDDKGGEYMSNAFLKFTTACGIERRHSVRNRPQQNGLAERANRTMGERITAMLAESGLPLSFWGYCIASMVHVWNRLPTSSLAGTTPFEAFYQRKPNVSHLRVWGCTAYVHIQRDKRNSLEPYAEKCVFIGYPSGYKGWLFYNPTTGQTRISERADFDERYFPCLSGEKRPKIPSFALPPSPEPSPELPATSTFSLPWDEGGVDDPLPDLPDFSSQLPSEPPSRLEPPSEPQTAPESSQSPQPESSTHPADSATTEEPTPSPTPTLPPLSVPLPVTPPQPPTPLPASPPPLRRSKRAPQPRRAYWKLGKPLFEPNAEDEHEEGALCADASYHLVQFAGAASGADPRSYKSAMSSPDADKWTEACNNEVSTLVANGTWELVELPPGAKVVNSGWVFKVKLNADGSVERYKSRLVAKGYSQRPGFDYTEVFAPTFRPASLRLIMALAAREGYKMRSVDISSAFTYGDLDEVIYMRQPEGYHQGGPNIVCKLHKSLYGLKQSARQWNKKLREVLEALGFKRLQSDNSIYIFSRGDIKIITPVFIDDITLVSKNDKAMDDTVKELQQHFKLRDLGPTTFLLSVQVKQDLQAHTISLSQSHYIDDLLERFQMDKAKPVKTPLSPGTELSQLVPTESEKQQMRNVPYLSAVGALQYLATMTRPDISYAVSYLGRFNHNPHPEHWTAVKHVLRYLKGTRDYKLIYSHSDDSELFITYSDADHGGCKKTSHSTGGYVTVVGGGAVGWSSKRQAFVTLSSTEAEYVAAVEAGKEIMWMRSILQEFGYPQSLASSLMIDNQSGIDVAKNPEHHGRMKHLDLRFYWLREKVEEGIMTPHYIPSSKNVADLLTKAVQPAVVNFAVPMLGLTP